MRKLVIILLLLNAILVVDLLLLQDIPPRVRADGAAATQNGDANGDSERDIADVIYLLMYLFKGGPEPVAIADSPEVLGRLAALENAVAVLQSAAAPGDVVSAAFSRLALLLDPSGPSPTPPPGTLRLAGCPDPQRPVLILTVGASELGDVIGFVGREEVSSLYSYEVAVKTIDLALDPSKFIGQKASLRSQINARTSYFSGEIAGFARAASTVEQATYVVRIVPAVARMTRHVGFRVFQNIKRTDAVYPYFADHGLPSPSVPTSAVILPYLLQYNESDWAFVSRLLEEEGIFYFFTHAAGGETIGMGKANTSFPAPLTIAYHGHLAEPPVPGEGYIRTFHAGTGVAIDSVTLMDFDYLQKKTLSATASQAGGGGDLTELGAFGLTQAEMDLQAQTGLRRQLLQGKQAAGTSNTTAIRAGQRIAVDDRAGKGFAGTYIVTSVRHMAVLAEIDRKSCLYYGNEFTAIPATLAYAPPRRTPIPTITAPLPAVVIDNNDPDRLGRVKVQLLGASGPDTFWARVATFSAGKERGAFFLPEKDDEVLVAFVGGDLRRPVVIGSLWNGMDRPPDIASFTSKNDKRIVRSRSGHRLVFDDTAGAEKIELSTSNGELLLQAAETRVSGTLTSESPAGPDSAVAPGERYQDNSIVAWASVLPDGTINGNEFGVESVVRNRDGIYTVVVDAQAAGIGQLIPLVSSVARSRPPPPNELRIASVYLAEPDTFHVYITDGARYVDGAFVFMATARAPAQ